MTRARPVLLVCGLLAALPASSPGQTRTCELLAGATAASRTVGETGREIIHVRGRSNWICTGGIRVGADSTVAEPGSNQLELIGNVVYSDSLKMLTAEWVKYFGQEERLLARDQVVLTDRASGSVIRGPELEYYRETPARPESRTYVRGRPHAIFYRTETTDGGTPGVLADSAGQPLEVDADRMDIRGQRSFHAYGQVEIEQGEARGFGREAVFDQASERLVLDGEARIEGERFTLFGQRIEGQLVGDELRNVIARRDAVLLAEDLEVDAPELRIFFEEGELNRLVAIGRPAGDSAAAEPDAAGDLRARALADDFRLVADSIDALAPAQGIERVVAVGNAYSERTVAAAAADLPDVASRDWLRGDTIIGYFGTDTVPAAPSATPESPPTVVAAAAGAPPAPRAPADSAEVTQVLERLVALGGEQKARSVYRLPAEGDATDGPAINYLIAERITLFLDQGEVSDVEADGPIRGIHLQPRQNGTAADSARVDGTMPVAPVHPGAGGGTS